MSAFPQFEVGPVDCIVTKLCQKRKEPALQTKRDAASIGIVTVAREPERLAEVVAMKVDRTNGQLARGIGRRGCYRKDHLSLDWVEILGQGLWVARRLEERISGILPGNRQPARGEEPIEARLITLEEDLNLISRAHTDNLTHRKAPLPLQWCIGPLPAKAGGAGGEIARSRECLPLMQNIEVIARGWRQHVSRRRAGGQLHRAVLVEWSLFDKPPYVLFSRIKRYRKGHQMWERAEVV